MKDKLFRLSLCGFAFVSIAGSIFHFVFEWSGYSRLAGIFTPVNESIWEHLKLLFFPYTIWTVIEYAGLKTDYMKILPAKAAGASAGSVFLIVFFYTYSGAFGKNLEFINILSFFAAVLLAFTIDYLIIKSGRTVKLSDTAGTAFFVIAGAVFIIFTFAPPLIPLFKDSASGTYGI